MRKMTALAVVSALTALGIPLASHAADGAAIYEKACKMCHATGAAGAPKVGDKADWKDRIAKGTPDLELSAINGFQGYGGNMPARGGFPKLTDDEVKAAVSYMVENSK